MNHNSSATRAVHSIAYTEMCLSRGLYQDGPTGEAYGAAQI